MIHPKLILEMKSAFERRENIMAFARARLGSDFNESDATLISYDLQSGSYTRRVQSSPEANYRWCRQLADIISPYLSNGDRLMEVGCGEATTLGGVLQLLEEKDCQAFGFDISWSRCSVGMEWLADQDVQAKLFVADLFSIPCRDSSVEVIYSSHSLEPNGGREEAALKELLRVAGRMVVLVEPIYELASEKAQERMRHHGYVRGLKETVEKLGGEVIDYQLLPFTANPLNPSGVITIKKINNTIDLAQKKEAPQWQCPYTNTCLEEHGDVFFSRDAGLSYPVMRGVPLLRSEHAVIASRMLG